MIPLGQEKAFHTVSQSMFLDNMESSLKRWLKGYLKGRNEYVQLNNRSKKLKKLKPGIPQSCVISTLSIHLYMNSHPTPPNSITIVSYTIAKDG